MKKYKFVCTHNESLENEEWETEKFVWNKDGYLYANSFEDFLDRFLARFSDSINEINLSETDHDSDNGTIWASNSVDGLDLKFCVTCEE